MRGSRSRRRKSCGPRRPPRGEGEVGVAELERQRAARENPPARSPMPPALRPRRQRLTSARPRARRSLTEGRLDAQGPARPVAARPAARPAPWPCANSAPPIRPKAATSSCSLRACRSAPQAMPSSRMRSAVAGPTPWKCSIGRAARKPSACSGRITVSPSGFSRPEAVLARNLLNETPAEAVRPGLAVDRGLDRPGDRHRRHGPALGLGDVEIGLVERCRLDQIGEPREDLADAAALALVDVEARRHEAKLGAQPQRAGSTAWPSARRTRRAS